MPSEPPVDRNDTPRPQGHYVPARRHADLIFVSGMTPRRDGVLLQTGPVAHAAPAESYRAAVELATANALHAAEAQLAVGEHMAGVISLTVYVNAPAGYVRHSQIADMASHLIAARYGGALPSRTAIGVASLPGDAVVEIAMVAHAAPSGR